MAALSGSVSLLLSIEGWWCHTEGRWRRPTDLPPSLAAPAFFLPISASPFPSHLLPRPPSFLYAMAHTNHFICRLLDFPDAARLQPPSHADPAFYFAHTERISGIKWPLVSVDALFFFFIFLLARFYRKILNVLKLAVQNHLQTRSCGVAWGELNMMKHNPTCTLSLSLIHTHRHTLSTLSPGPLHAIVPLWMSAIRGL